MARSEPSTPVTSGCPTGSSLVDPVALSDSEPAANVTRAYPAASGELRTDHFELAPAFRLIRICTVVKVMLSSRPQLAPRLQPDANPAVVPSVPDPCVVSESSRQTITGSLVIVDELPNGSFGRTHA